MSAFHIKSQEDRPILLLDIPDLEVEQKIAIYKLRSSQHIRTVMNQKSHFIQTSTPCNHVMASSDNNCKSKTEPNTKESEYKLLSSQNQLGLADIWDYDIGVSKEKGEHWFDSR